MKLQYSWTTPINHFVAAALFVKRDHVFYANVANANVSAGILLIFPE